MCSIPISPIENSHSVIVIVRKCFEESDESTFVVDLCKWLVATVDVREA